MTILEALRQTIDALKDRGIENPRLEAELLLAHSLGLSKEKLYTCLRDPMPEPRKETLGELVRRRTCREPLPYILGRQEFWSIDLKVDPRVLIPRPETEHLVEEALVILKSLSSPREPVVLELGTGSGAIAISLVKEAKEIFLVATDISEEALKVARENAEGASVSNRIRFVRGDLLQPFLPRGGFDLILSNPPYIPEPAIEGLMPEIRHYEPLIALRGGEDGLDFYRRLIPQCPSYLREGGWLLLEVGSQQAGIVLKMMEEDGRYQLVEILKDLSGRERVVKAQRRRTLNGLPQAG
ncbi:MAG: peptide chain release factor N(5)-glutamine methyltransferase [Desulfobacterota bacterium]|nr:peptide chain release factor N(5)-glutamine methyltransferase [Thermodesulfobacteriota bacterium]